MDLSNLELLHNRLKEEFDDYVSMVGVGSFVVGDPYIEGRSDKDILLIFKNNPPRLSNSFQNILSSFNFDDSYLFTLMPKDNFGIPNSKYSFSNVFRSKTLFGEDLVLGAKLSIRPFIEREVSKGLFSVKKRLYTGLINSGFWSVDKVRSYFWKQFKHAFMYLSSKFYYDNNLYPKNRLDLVKRLDSKELLFVHNVLHSINSKSKIDVVSAAKVLFKLLE